MNGASELGDLHRVFPSADPVHAPERPAFHHRQPGRLGRPCRSCGLVDTAQEFYWSDSFSASAGFFPGVIVYLTHWFRYQDRAKAVALVLIVGIALSLSIAAGNHLVLAIAAFSATTMALYSFPSPFWALPTIF